MPYEIRIVTVESLTLAAVCATSSRADLAGVIPRTCGEAWEAVARAQIPNTGRLVTHYLDDVIHLEAGVEVTGPVPEGSGLTASITPSGKAAWAVHLGPYVLLGQAHDALVQWCEKNGSKRAGPRWEIYGQWNEDPSLRRTDVYHLLEA